MDIILSLKKKMIHTLNNMEHISKFFKKWEGIGHYKHKIDEKPLFEAPSKAEVRWGMAQRHRGLINRAMLGTAEKQGIIHIGPSKINS